MMGDWVFKFSSKGCSVGYTIYANGRVETFDAPADSMLVINKIPRIVAQAEQAGYAKARDEVAAAIA